MVEPKIYGTLYTLFFFLLSTWFYQKYAIISDNISFSFFFNDWETGAIDIIFFFATTNFQFSRCISSVLEKSSSSKYRCKICKSIRAKPRSQVLKYENLWNSLLRLLFLALCFEYLVKKIQFFKWLAPLWDVLIIILFRLWNIFTYFCFFFHDVFFLLWWDVPYLFYLSSICLCIYFIFFSKNF